MKTGIDLIYKVKGNVDEGISVFDLSPILISAGTIIKEACRTLYPDDPEIAVNVKPIEKGSLDFNYFLYPINKILNYTDSDSMQHIHNVLQTLGYVATISGLSLMGFLKWLKGRKIKSVEPVKDSEDVKVTTEDNSTTNVNGNVIYLFQNSNVQLNYYNAVAKPLETPGAESAESYVKQNEGATKVVHNKGDIKTVKDYTKAELFAVGEPETTENIRTIWVRPITANLAGGPKSWSFKTADDERIVANISDEKFLEVIKSGAKLSYMDRLLVVMKDTQLVKGMYMSVIHEIIEVKEYVKGPEQEYLFKK